MEGRRDNERQRGGRKTRRRDFCMIKWHMTKAPQQRHGKTPSHCDPRHWMYGLRMHPLPQTPLMTNDVDTAPFYYSWLEAWIICWDDASRQTVFPAIKPPWKTVPLCGNFLMRCAFDFGKTPVSVFHISAVLLRVDASPCSCGDVR